MAANTLWQLEREYHTVSDSHDLLVRVIEHSKVSRTEGIGGAVVAVTESFASKVHEFKVKREALINSSDYFATMLADGKFKEEEAAVVDVKSEDPVTAVTVWFKIVHDAVDEAAYAITADDVWYMLAAAQTYGFNTKSEAAKVWFEQWYGKQLQGVNGNGPRMLDYKEHQMMLLPTFSFDCIDGFKTATKYLVYRATGNIMERRPLEFEHDDIKIDANILQQLNAAKARLKTILHRHLYNPIEDLVRRARCRCKAEVLWAYEFALTRTGSWPLESTFLNNSVDRTLRQLENFQVWLLPTCGGRFCSFDFHNIVGNARIETKRYFDGLCLDCMHTSQHAEQTFWDHAKPIVQWDADCRTKHSQPSWYFSFLGPRYKMVEWVDSKRNPGQLRGVANVQQQVGAESVAAGSAESTAAAAAEDATTRVAEAGVDGE